MALIPENVTFFPRPEDFRKWLENHHDKQNELWVGYYKVSSGKPSITWAESVDEALCYGWIDGIRKSLDEESYTIRFTPRKKKSNWSAVNLKRVPELIEMGRMQPAGMKIYEGRDGNKEQRYSYENEKKELGEEYELAFKANKQAWENFHKMPASYRKAAIWWVISAKREDTRHKRLTTLIEDSENNRRIAQLTRPGK